MNIIRHLQSAWPEIGLDGVGPAVASMDHHGASQVLHISDPFLRDSILKMGVDPTVRDGLSTGLDIIYKQVLSKAAIVRVAMLDPDAMGGTACLKLTLALDRLFGSRPFLDV